MLRTWKTFGLQTALAAILTAAPITTLVARAADPDIKELDRRLKSIEESFAEIQKNADAIVKEGLKFKALDTRLKSLEEQLARMETTLDALRKGTPAEGRVATYPPERMDDLKARVDRIEHFLERSTRISRAAPSTGRILLLNQYPEDIIFVVNGIQYPLAPNTTRLLDGFPSGTVSYQVFSPRWGERANRTTTLQAEETFRITVD